MNCSIGMRKPEEQPSENLWNIGVFVSVKRSHYHTEVDREPTDCEHRDNYYQHFDHRLTFPHLFDVSLLIYVTHWWLARQKKPSDQKIKKYNEDEWNSISKDNFQKRFCFEKSVVHLLIFMPFFITVLYSSIFIHFCMYLYRYTLNTNAAHSQTVKMERSTDRDDWARLRRHTITRCRSTAMTVSVQMAAQMETTNKYEMPLHNTVPNTPRFG